MYWRSVAAIVAAFALCLPATASAARTLDLHPHQVKFGKQPFFTLETRTITIENVSSELLVVTTAPELPDDFSHLIDSTCALGDTQLAAGESCTVVIGFRPTPFFAGLETARVIVTARDLAGNVVFEGTVVITGRGV
jgi:hypothetical protein